MFRSIGATVASLALGTAAAAADLPSIKSAPVAASVPIWTGLHVGLNAGGTWGAGNSVNLTTLPAYLIHEEVRVEGRNYRSALYNYALPTAVGVTNNLSPNPLGFIGGGQIGYDQQTSFNNLSFVTGIEADIQGIASANSSVSGAGITQVGSVVESYSSGQPITTITSVTKNLNYLGTVRGRFGLLVTQNLLIYGTGGVAYGGVNLQSTTQSYAPTLSPLSEFTYAWGGSGGFSDVKVGWTAGGGAEWMFMPGWSLKGEYLYYDLGNVAYNQGNSGAQCTPANRGGFSGLNTTGQYWWANNTYASTRFNGNLARLGINYHFDPSTSSSSSVISPHASQSLLMWSGLYAGVNAGGSWGAGGGTINSWNLDGLRGFATNNISGSNAGGGISGGGQIGYNYQLSNVSMAGMNAVIGAEADFQGTSGMGDGKGPYLGVLPNIENHSNTLKYVPTIVGAGINISWFGTARGRLGLTVMPTLLLYGTGGFAYAEVQRNNGWNSTTQTGWSAGGGAEWMFIPNWSAKVEYLYADVSGGNSTSLYRWSTSLDDVNNQTRWNTVRTGMNYHFSLGAAPAVVAAKY